MSKLKKLLSLKSGHDEDRRRKFEEALQQVNRKYGRMLKRLAE